MAKAVAAPPRNFDLLSQILRFFTLSRVTPFAWCLHTNRLLPLQGLQALTPAYVMLGVIFLRLVFILVRLATYQRPLPLEIGRAHV